MLYYAALVVAVIGWGLHLAWRWKMAKDFAPQLLRVRKASGELPETIDEGEFTDLYLRAEGPRAGTYIFVCAAILTAALAPLSGLFNSVWEALWRASGAPPVFEIGTLIHTFLFFLFFMGLAIGLLAAAMHRYYTLMPPNLKQVMRALREAHS